MDDSQFQEFMATDFGVAIPNIQWDSNAPAPVDMRHEMPGLEPWMLQAQQPEAVQAQPAGSAPPNQSANNQSAHPGPEVDDGRRECPHCQGRFKDLNRHLAQQACTGTNPKLPCPHPECVASGLTFQWPKDLERHESSLHSGTRFHCRFDGCQKDFNRLDNCRRHESRCRMKPQV